MEDSGPLILMSIVLTLLFRGKHGETASLLHPSDDEIRTLYDDSSLDPSLATQEEWAAHPRQTGADKSQEPRGRPVTPHPLQP